MGNGSSWQGRGVALLRMIVGGVFLMHGGQKIFYYGIHGVGRYFASVNLPSPQLLAPLVTAVELLGGVALLLGLGTRWAAVLLAMDMVGVILAVKLSGGFFAPAGFEYEFTLLFACIALVLAGPGPASVESLLGGRK
jgi:putative oxidoreductase